MLKEAHLPFYFLLEKQLINYNFLRQPKVTADQNPFNKVRFSLQSAVSGQGFVELYNMLRKKAKTNSFQHLYPKIKILQQVEDDMGLQWFKDNFRAL